MRRLIGNNFFWVIGCITMPTRLVGIPTFIVGTIKLWLRRAACTERKRSVQDSVQYSANASQFTQSEAKGRTLVRSVRYSSFFVGTRHALSLQQSPINIFGFCMKFFILLGVSVSPWFNSNAQRLTINLSRPSAAAVDPRRRPRRAIRSRPRR
jgi:hypothetical protein